MFEHPGWRLYVHLLAITCAERSLAVQMNPADRHSATHHMLDQCFAKALPLIVWVHHYIPYRGVECMVACGTCEPDQCPIAAATATGAGAVAAAATAAAAAAAAAAAGCRAFNFHP